MKWVTCMVENQEKVGWVAVAQGSEYIITLDMAKDWLQNQRQQGPPLAETVLQLIESGEQHWNEWQRIASLINDHPEWVVLHGYSIAKIKLSAPIPKPPSVRDFYAFEEHVKKARAKRGLEIIPEWYKIPVFYFSNHRAVIGPNTEVSYPKGSEKLDYELELACVIGKEGRDISAQEAEQYIFGYTIMNDWSARDLQAEEVKVGLGPAKGKDFATSIGPYLVTPDELIQYRSNTGNYDLEMSAFVNGKRISYGNFNTIYYSFAQMIARASENVTLYPGDVIGSGTVGTGCLLELGEEVHRWLLPGDKVTLSITGLGSLTNRIVES